MMPNRIAVLAMGALLGACAYNAPMNDAADPLMTPLAADRAQPRLALVEHVLANYFASDIVAPPTICASVSDGRSETALPPEQETALIARFPQLAPFSRCSWTGSAWRDTATEEPALVFTIHSFVCASETRCSGWAGYTAGATSSISSRYTMDYVGGRWTFERDRRLIAE